jgi:aspartate aminotransferase
MLAQSLDRLGTETAFETLARAKALEAQGRRVVHLEIGEPDFPTAPHIVEAAAKALRDGHTHYCPAAGLPELREACAQHLSRHRGLAIDPQRVLIAPGAKPFLFFAVLATCNPGDEVLYPNPGFPIYESVIRWAGATPVPLPLVEDRGFAFTADDLAERLTPRTKMVILNSPANPTGGIVERSLNAEIAGLLAGHDCWILSDEVYAELRYDGEHDTIAAHEGLFDRTILVDGFSKTFAMTGWRLGYAALPTELVEPVTRLIINSVSCTAPAVQLAGVAALEGPRTAVDAMLEEFRRRRDVIVPRLNALPGVSCVMPRGAFYAFPNVTGTGLPARELAERLLVDAGVALLSGTAFGKYGEGYLRISYANSLEQIEEALLAIEGTLESLQPQEGDRHAAGRGEALRPSHQ